MSPARQRFIEDEMMRVPMLAEQVFDATLEAMRLTTLSGTPHDRAVASDLLRTATAQRNALVQRFVESVRLQVRVDLGVDPARPAAPPPAAPGASRPALALLDEDEVAADVEISHSLEAIKTVAEHELRELATFVSALAGDMDVRRDHNPFRAETYAKALWEAAQAVPMARGFQVRLMRLAGGPLAELLRKAYAGACARLEDAGVEPAVYRTVVVAAGAKVALPAETFSGRAPDLHQMRRSMPATAPQARSGEAVDPVLLDRMLDDVERLLQALPAEAPLTERAELLSAQRTQMVRHAPQAVDQQVIELLSRLFDAMLADPRVPREVQVTLSRLQPSIMRLALRDPRLLDDYMHPAWQFMDQIAHQAALLQEQGESATEALKFAEGLIDTVSRESAPGAEPYRWALERLAAADRERLETRVQRAAVDIAMLQALEDKLAERADPLPTGAGPLDETQLETVPAELMDDLPAPRANAPDVKTWLTQRRPGDWVRLFHREQWLRVQLLWRGRRADAWLFGEASGKAHFALRRRALERLYVEGLANSVRTRSLVRAAAEQMMRSMKATPAA